jgi:Fe-S cluster assembly iron-binding protein IscA
MLVLTRTAVAVVNTLTTAEGQPEGTGLRISADTAPAGGGLQVQVTSGPAEDDQVLAEEGVRVFLDPDAATYLDDKVLDAKVDGQGGAQFTLGEQNTDNGHPPA